MAEEEQITYRKARHVIDPVPPKIPSIIQSTRSKSTISSLLSTFTPNTTSTGNKYFRGLGCAAPAQVSVPAIIRTSANWEGKKTRKKKQKQKKKKNSSCSSIDVGGDGGGLVSVVPDVWCAPGIGFSTDAASVDCVVSRRAVSGRGTVDGEKMNTRERSSCGGRRSEELPFLHTDVYGSRNYRHVRHEGLAEVVLFQGNLLMGGRLDQDRYREWRLDVDTMSYEELLELGDKIGYVNTGLREEEIGRCVTKISVVPTQMQWKCSVCQEEYEGEDEMGKLECGHFYHMYCINQWLLQRKTCPICKTSVS